MATKKSRKKTKRRKPKRKSKPQRRTKRAKSEGPFYVVTFIFLSVFTAAVFAILNNQFKVSVWLYVILVLDIIAIIIMIQKKWFTTEETIAFRRIG